jgi:hypothetical protein
VATIWIAIEEKEFDREKMNDAFGALKVKSQK